MKIFMYSDLHISKTSSILPLSSTNSKYTYRQNMIIELGKYLENIIDQEKPDLIINLGDTFDQHTITSFDIDVASEFFKCFKYLNIPHLVLVGNHEMINYDFNAIELLSNINNITVISEPCTIQTKLLTNVDDDINLAFMPYMEYQDILSFPEGDFLFSHLDIMGMQIRGTYELPNGVSIQDLSKYKLVFNGHFHKSSIKNNIVNVGSVTTHSFADDDNSVPQCYLFDTNTLELQTFKPTVCPLFRKYEMRGNLSDLCTYVDSLDQNYKYVLQVTSNFEEKDKVKTYLTGVEPVIASRLNVKVDNVINETRDVPVALQSNLDIKKSFTEFLDTIELKYPNKLYLDILEGVK